MRLFVKLVQFEVWAPRGISPRSGVKEIPSSSERGSGVTDDTSEGRCAMRCFVRPLIQMGLSSVLAAAVCFTSTTARAQVVTTTPVVPAASQVAFSPWFMGGGGSYGGG